jgi:hypothetical protein
VNISTTVYLLRLFVFFLIATASESLAQTTRSLEKKNPTFYIFSFSANEARGAIEKGFSGLPGYRYMRLEQLSGKKLQYFLEEKKSVKVASEGDYYLRYSNAIGSSEIYFDKKKRPLSYYAEFLLHLSSVDGGTKVEIITIRPRVVTGQSLLPKLPHFARVEKTKPVEPSTIEEYEILLKIGTSLGVSGRVPPDEPCSGV